ncbi:hypothetical protein [Streptomyces sp. CG 926]|uniref:hypothetical protein n=1 Tax=Streptomyces sp. CG 926 TaxID=1882405 RepID=UPI0035C21DB7
MKASTTNATEAMARRILSEYGETYAHEAGIGLRDTPAPLYRLLVLCVPLSAPIRASTAVAADGGFASAGPPRRAGTGAPPQIRREHGHRPG